MCGPGAPPAWFGDAEGPIELCPPCSYPAGLHPITAQAGVTLVSQLVLPQGEALSCCPGQCFVASAYSIPSFQHPREYTARIIPILSTTPILQPELASMTGTCLKILLVCWDVHLMLLTRTRIYSEGGKIILSLQRIQISIPNPSVAFCC